MKRVIGILFLFIAYNAQAIEFDSSLSGIWYNANQSGHGLNIAVLDENLSIVYWYVYHTDGTPMFLTTVGENQGDRITGVTYYNTGMKFGEFNPADIVETEWGTSTVIFTDCNNATLEYSSNVSGYGNGSIQMVRLASLAGLKCSDSPLHGNYNGSWSVAGEIGYGIASLFENGDMVFWAESDTSAEVGIGQWWTTSDHTFQFEGNTYSVFGGENYIAGSGNFSEDNLTAFYTGGGYLFAAPMQSFQHGLTTAKLAGSYDVYDWDDSLLGSVTIQNNGALTGTTNAGCQVNGTFIVPNTLFNQAFLSDASISGCNTTANFDGAAVYRNATEEIVIAAADNSTGYAWTLKQQP